MFPGRISATSHSSLPGHAAPDRRDQTGADRGGLPAPGRADDAEQRRAGQPCHELGDEPLASEEEVRIPDVEGRESLERRPSGSSVR